MILEWLSLPPPPPPHKTPFHFNVAPKPLHGDDLEKGIKQHHPALANLLFINHVLWWTPFGPSGLRWTVDVPHILHLLAARAKRALLARSAPAVAHEATIVEAHFCAPHTAVYCPNPVNVRMCRGVCPSPADDASNACVSTLQAMHPWQPGLSVFPIISGDGRRHWP